MAHRALSVAADRYKNATFIGKGGFSVAFRAVRKADGMEIVVKETSIHELSVSSGETVDVWRAKAEREFTLMAKTKHANIVRALDFYIIDNHAHLLLEFCDAGSLKSVTARRLGAKNRGEAGLFPETKIWRWIAQMVRATRYLHDQCKILHRDIKAENVFLTDGGEVAKLGDFGISRQLDTMRSSVEMTSATPNYIPPETLPPPCKKYNSQSDVWALGVVSQLIANLRLPFDATSIPDLMQAIIRNEPPALSQDYSDDLQQLIVKMLSKDPDLRPTIDEIWTHRRIESALQELAVRFPRLDIDLSTELPRANVPPSEDDGGRLANEMKDELRAFVRELEDKDMACRLRMKDLEHELASSNAQRAEYKTKLSSANAQLAKVEKELADAKTQHSTLESNLNELLVTTGNELVDERNKTSLLEYELASSYSKLLQTGKMVDTENKNSDRDYFKSFPQQPQTFFRNAPSQITAILAIPVDDWLRGTTSTATALVIVCDGGQIIALAPPSWKKQAWRYNVRLPAPLSGNPKFCHAAYDITDNTVYINHNRTTVLALPCANGAKPRIAIEEKRYRLTDVSGLAIASEQRRLFICNRDAANEGLTIWGLPHGTETGINLLATMKSDSVPEFCGLGWQEDALWLATSSIQNKKVELRRVTVGLDWLANPAAPLLMRAAFRVGDPKEVAFDEFGNLLVASADERRIEIFSPSRGWNQPVWVSGSVGQHFGRLAIVTGEETPRVVTYGDSGYTSLAVFKSSRPSFAVLLMKKVVVVAIRMISFITMVYLQGSVLAKLYGPASFPESTFLCLLLLSFALFCAYF